MTGMWMQTNLWIMILFLFAEAKNIGCQYQCHWRWRMNRTCMAIWDLSIEGESILERIVAWILARFTDQSSDFHSRFIVILHIHHNSYRIIESHVRSCKIICENVWMTLEWDCWNWSWRWRKERERNKYWSWPYWDLEILNSIIDAKMLILDIGEKSKGLRPIHSDLVLRLQLEFLLRR
jgi:hypothetical protein